jgi:hypothetical protein
MGSLRDRLREAMGVAGARARSVTTPLTLASPLDAADSAAEVLGGRWAPAGDASFLVVERSYAGGHRHGHMSVLDSLPPATGVWNRLSLLAGDAGRLAHPAARGTHRVLFLDLETTGLAGGAGTYAFLVGLAWFDGAALRVRQFFLSAYSAERAVLEALAELVADAAAVVTFNGKSFDVPLIESRFAINRLPTPFGGVPHVDLLHPARRLWRRVDEQGDAPEESSRIGCRLSDLELAICGHLREGDVPGFEIPARYFHFVRSGDARPLVGVFEHNRQDLVSLAMLTARATRLLDEGPRAASTVREAFGLGSCYERAGLVKEARDAYMRAAGLCQAGFFEDGAVPAADDGPTRAEALRALARLARRDRRFDEAADAWSRALAITTCPPAIAREAAEALAVHHEHRARNLDVARRFAMQSMQYGSTAAKRQASRHRLARLERKLGRPEDGAPLF